MEQNEKWHDKYVTDYGSKEHIAQKAGGMAGGAGGFLAAMALATGPIGLAVLLVAGIAAGTAAAAHAVPPKKDK